MDSIEAICKNLKLLGMCLHKNYRKEHTKFDAFVEVQMENSKKKVGRRHVCWPDHT